MYLVLRLGYLFVVCLIDRMPSKTVNWNKCGSAYSVIVTNCPGICLERLEGHAECYGGYLVFGLASEFGISQIQSKDATFSAMMFVVCVLDIYIKQEEVWVAT